MQRLDLRRAGVIAFWTGAVLLITFLIGLVTTRLLRHAADRNASPDSTLRRIIPLVHAALWTLAIFAILGFIVDIGSAALMIAAGALLLFLGLTAMNSLRDVIGGITLIIDPPFQTGDRVTIDGTHGEVVAIGLRSTRILTAADALVTVPNSIAAGRSVHNHSKGARTCPVVVDLYLPGHVDPAHGRRIVHEAAVSSQFVYLEKPVEVRVRDVRFDAPLTQLTVTAHVIDGRFEIDFASDVTEAAKTAFLNEGLIVQTTTGLSSRELLGNGEDD